MTAIKTPNIAVPDDAQTVVREWTAGAGEQVTSEWTGGTRQDIEELYLQKMAEGEAGANIASLVFQTTNGRAVLKARFGRQGTEFDGYGEDIGIIEELYEVPILKDVYNHPYFGPGGAGELVTDAVAWVRRCADNQWTSTEITTQANALGEAAWSTWTPAMKQLHYHLLHGAPSAITSSFVLRRSLYGVRTSYILTSFDGINTVVPDPSFKSQMDKLVNALPDGEWMKRCPDVEHLGKGRWRCTETWQWAESWSVIYDGTWGYSA